MPKGKIQNEIMDYGRDGLGLGVTGIAGAATSGLTKAIVSGVMIWASPKIAKTSEGKMFNRFWALLNLVDGVIEMALGSQGVLA